MSASNAFYRTLVLPSILIYRTVKAVIFTPVLLVINTILIPFRFIYALLASLWWILPFSAHHSQSNPPTITEFLLLSLLIGLISGVLLYFTSRILFSLPQLLGATTGAEDLVPTAHEVQKRIGEQAKRVSLLQQSKPQSSRVTTTDEVRFAAPDYTQPRVGLDRSTPELANRGPAEWEDRWQQQQQQHHFEPVSPTAVLTPSTPREGFGVAAQTIVEEDSDDDDSDYF